MIGRDLVHDFSTSIPKDVVYGSGAKCAFELKNGEEVSGLLNSLDMLPKGGAIGVRNSNEKFYLVSDIAGNARIFYSKEENDLVLFLGETEAVE